MNKNIVTSLIFFLTFININNIFGQTPTNNLVKLKITGGLGADEMIVYFYPEASDGYDASVDAIKMLSGNPGVPNIYSRIGEDDISINVMGEFDTDKSVPVGVKVTQTGVYNISVIELNFDPLTMVYLEDRVKNKFFNLKDTQNNTLKDTLITSVYTNRFFLHFKLPAKITTQNETCKQNDGKIIIDNPSTTSSLKTKLVPLSGQKLNILNEDTFIIYAESILKLDSLSGGDYNLNLFHSPNGSIEYLQILPITIDSAIIIDPQFDVIPNDTVLQGQSVRFESVNSNIIADKYFTYIWNLGNGTIYDTTSKYIEYSYLDPAVYTVQLTINYGTCQDYSEQLIIVLPDIITDINNSSLDFNIYPNPTRDYIIIDNNKFISIEISDAYGKKYQNFQIIKNSEKNSKIDITSLDSGIYFLSIVNSKKIVKLKIYKVD